MGVRVKEKRAFLKRKRDNYARKLRRKKLINYLRSQLRTCTTHGLPHIVNTEIHWFERLFWTASFLFSLGLIYNLISTQYTRFKSTPIVSIVEMDYFNWNVSYPAISLCPIDNVDDDNMYIAASERLELSGENIEAHLRAICSLSMDTMDTIDFDSLNVSSSLHPEDHAVLAALLFRKFDNNSLTTSTNWPISIETAMTEVGLCHVINSNVANFDNPTKWGIATYEKKNVDLTVNEKDFFVQIVNYADMYKVFIHSPDEIILSTTATYTSKRNTFTQFGVQVWSTRISNVLRSTPISIRKCRFKDEPISERYPVYSYNHCLLECRIKMILNICDCIPHFYKPLENERICNLTELQCFIEFKEAFIKLSISNGITNNFSYPAGIPQSPRDCDCLNSCESDVYRKDHETFSPEAETNRMRISISAYPKVRVVKDAIINTFDIILRSGGVINLCIGASIISLMELVMLAFKLLLHLLWLMIECSFKRITVYPTCMNRIKEKIIKKQH